MSMTSIGLPEARTVVNVLVTGSRVYTDRATIFTALRAVEAAAVWRWPGPYRFRLFHGACPLRPVNGVLGSADMIADSVARQLLWEVVESAPGVAGFPADWRKHGKAAGHIRNGEMVDVLSAQEGMKECVGFPVDTEGLRVLDVPYEGPLPEFGGTWDCLKRARKAGIRTWWAYPGMGSDLEAAA